MHPDLKALGEHALIEAKGDWDVARELLFHRLMADKALYETHALRFVKEAVHGIIAYLGGLSRRPAYRGGLQGETREVPPHPGLIAAQQFSPTRRALMHVIGDALVKQNKLPEGGDATYRAVYVARKAYERARAPQMTPMHAHKRAMRLMEKRLIRDLWAEWRTISSV